MALSKKIFSDLIMSLSDMKNIDYSASPELYNIFKRLQTGKNAFAEIYEMNVNSVSEISALDLEIRFYTKQLMDITDSVSAATNDIHSSAKDAN